VNGNTPMILMMVINGLLGLVVLMLAYILKSHKESDDRTEARLDKEIGLLRTRSHELGSKVAGLEILNKKAGRL
jgi:hypothetical protein